MLVHEENGPQWTRRRKYDRRGGQRGEGYIAQQSPFELDEGVRLKGLRAIVLV